MLLTDQAQDCRLVSHIVALVCTEQGAVRAHSGLATGQADKLLDRAMLLAKPNGFLHLLLLFHF